MEYRIGKANVYYTLWTVTDYGNYYKYEYQQNLSKDLEAAKKKAPEGAVYDETIKGTHSFKRDKTWTPRIERPADEFPCGKYAGEKITNITDIDYLAWAYNAILRGEGQEIAGRILEEHGYKVFSFGLMTPEEVAKEKEVEQYLKEVTEQVEAQQNLEFFIEGKPCYECVEGKSCCEAIYRMNNRVYLNFLEVKNCYYNGWEYPMPIDSKGKAKRVHGKTIVVTDYEPLIYWNEIGDTMLKINIKGFTVKK